MAPAPSTMDVLRRRDVRLLLGGQAVSVFGDRMVAVALAFAVLEVGGSASSVGLVLACGALPLVACLPLGGVVADRTSRRAVMVGADVVRLVSQGVAATLLLTGVAEVWSLAACAAITGAATGFFNPASTGLLPAVVPAGELQQANGLRATAVSAGEIGGPLVAGVVVAAASPGWALAGDAATFAASALLLASMRLPARAPRAAGRLLADLAHGWTEFRARRWVWSVVASVALGTLCWGAWSSLGPVVADRELGGAAVWGAVLGAMGAGALVGGLLATRASPRRPLVVVLVASAVFGLPLGVLATTPPVVVVVVAALLSGGAMMLANAVWETTLQRRIPEASLSRVSSYDWFGSMATYPVGLALWGPVSAATGTTAALWLAFALLLVAALAPLALRDVRELSAGTTPR